jgi:hypothetical protein
MKIYYHPNNPHKIVSVGEGYAWWVILFGAVWFWFKGMVARGFLYWFLSILTLGLFWFIAPFFAYRQYEQHLIERGYKIKEDR